MDITYLASVVEVIHKIKLHFVHNLFVCEFPHNDVVDIAVALENRELFSPHSFTGTKTNEATSCRLHVS